MVVLSLLLGTLERRELTGQGSFVLRSLQVNDKLFLYTWEPHNTTLFRDVPLIRRSL